MAKINPQHYKTRVRSTASTPQSESIPGREKDMVANTAGGFTFKLDKWAQLNRFLILGTEGGTYYISEKKLTVDNAKNIEACVAEDGLRTVKTIVDVSVAGRAPKNDPALYALAVAASAEDDATRKAALDALPQVARTGTHLQHFMEYVQLFRGWGRGLRKAAGSWFTAQEPKNLAFQMLKYQQRDGWHNRDILRLSHPKVTVGSEHDFMFRLATVGWNDKTVKVKRGNKLVDEVRKGASTLVPELPGSEVVALVEAVRSLKGMPADKAAQVIADYRLAREMVPTELLTEPEVWNALLQHMPLGAMVRNLGVMTARGILAPLSAGAKKVVSALGNQDAILKARLHPVSVLAALKTYQQGHGQKGSLAWDPVSNIVDALDKAFYMAFGNVPSTGKGTMLALDVSGSMGNAYCAGLEMLTCREGSAAMALVTAAVEPNHFFVGFTSSGYGYGGRWGGGNAGLTTLDISPRMRLDTAINKVSGLPFGGTDCALPMLYAAQNKLEVETFCVYTDNETWAGTPHPSQALEQYRQKMGLPARLVVIGMEANPFTIADPNDAGMMDVSGFDSAAPTIIADFAAGKI